MLEFFKETFFTKPMHAIFFGALMFFFIVSHAMGWAFFHDIKTENTKAQYRHSSSFYHK